ncbi:MAG: hypothetical protein IMZ62_11980 [Chloroflexi bacterium]|nr:hypothetical protein [Chloroflexota bacterium]
MADTSCVFALLCPALDPCVANEIPPPSDAAVYCKGQYLRMEFIRRWLCTAMELFFLARRLGNYHRAVQEMSNKQGARDAKAVLIWVNKYGARFPNQSSADLIREFGNEILRFARSYDKAFSITVSPYTGCKRGEVEFQHDMPTVAAMLRDFYKRFQEEDHTCRLSKIVTNDPAGRSCLSAILNANPKDYDERSRRGLRALMKDAHAFIAKDATPSCKTCHKIGDILIALEQPKDCVLYHTDHAFLALCPILGKENVSLAKFKLAKGIHDAVEDAATAMPGDQPPPEDI